MVKNKEKSKDRTIPESAQLHRIKTIALLAMVSDDDLMNLLVLKGGNALDLVYKLNGRSSLDLDFSMEGRISDIDRPVLVEKIMRALESNFLENGLVAFDIKFADRPPEITSDMESFWGGYRVEFKVIDVKSYEKAGGNIESLRRQSEIISPHQGKKFYIDISRFEYCGGKQPEDVDGYTVYVYTPVMIVIEKLRAICQQMPEYAAVVNNPSRSARARDFFDIVVTLKKFDIDFESEENIELLKKIFVAKRVPLNFLGLIRNYREYHRPDFASVIATVPSNFALKEFDFYFDYVADVAEKLKPFWIE